MHKALWAQPANQQQTGGSQAISVQQQGRQTWMMTAIGSSRISDALMGIGNTAYKPREASKTSLIRATTSAM
jgi:hypothetical protein